MNVTQADRRIDANFGKNPERNRRYILCVPEVTDEAQTMVQRSKARRRL